MPVTRRVFACLLALAMGAGCGEAQTGGAPLEYCASGQDDDGDGLVDCDDPDCAAFSGCLARPEQCANGRDDDGDGDTDCADPDCDGTFACSARAEDCANGRDEDGDGDTDCADADCAGSATCAPLGEACVGGQDEDGDGDVDCDDSDCAKTAVCVGYAERCADGEDNDRDGQTDCDDDACARTAECLPEGEACASGADEDGDGLTDCADPDCADGYICNPLAEVCAGGFDDNLDGLVDCDDPQCGSAPGCFAPLESCAEGEDLDGDGLAGCDDPDCAQVARCLEEATCGAPGLPDCPPRPESCSGGIDEDGDGLIDCQDLDDCIDEPRCFDEICGTGQAVVPDPVTSTPDPFLYEFATYVEGDLQISLVGPGDITAFSGIRCIRGDLLIDSPDLRSVVGLGRLRYVSGRVRFIAAEGLTDLEGLMSLEKIGGLEIQNMPNFRFINALGSVRSMTSLVLINAGVGSLASLSGLAPGSLSQGILITGSTSLRSLEGLESVRTLTTLTLVLNEGLTDISALSGLTEVSRDASIVGHDNLASLEGLGSLVEVGGLFNIESNGALTGLGGLESLEVVGGEFNVESNASLSSVAALGSLRSVGAAGPAEDLKFVLNPMLTSLAGLSALEEVGGYLWLAGNLNLSDLGAYSPTLSLGSLYLGTNPGVESLAAFSGLTELGNLTLSETGIFDLSGLEGLGAVTGGITITSNPSLGDMDALRPTTFTGPVLILENQLAPAQADALASYLVSVHPDSAALMCTINGAQVCPN